MHLRLCLDAARCVNPKKEIGPHRDAEMPAPKRTPVSGLTESVARFIAGMRSSDFPPQAVEKAKKVVADTFACIIAGAGSEVAKPLLCYAERAGAIGDRPVLATRLRTSPEL